MQAGLKAGVPYEVACGGNAECCTCHVYMPESLLKESDYEPPKQIEIDALDWADGHTAQSRLAC